MPLSSNRKQDYQQCRWRLGTAMEEVLKISPDLGTRALIDALIGKVKTLGFDSNIKPDYVNLVGRAIELRGYTIEFDDWTEEPEDGHSGEDDLLRQYVRFLRKCSPESFGISVEAASREYATAAIWSRIFGVGSERVAEVGDLLWPLVEKPDFLENGDTQHDTVRFVAAALPSRSIEDRKRFEEMLLDETRFTNEVDIRRWHGVLGQIFASVSVGSIELESTLALRRRLDADGRLTKGEPAYRSTVHDINKDDFVKNELERAGIDSEAGPNKEVIEKANALHAQVERTQSTSPSSDLAALWREAITLIALIDANPGLDDLVYQPAWGYVAHAIEKIASSANFLPGFGGLPDLITLFAVLERLSSSQYPDVR